MDERDDYDMEDRHHGGQEGTRPTDLDELSRLLEQATPGPWDVLDLTEEGCEVLSLASSADPHCVVARIANVVSDRPIGADDRANAALIAALRNAAEELVRDARACAEIRRVIALGKDDGSVGRVARRAVAQEQP